MSALAEVLTGLRAAVESVGVRWYVFGAQAAIAHGSSRATKDVDVTVFVDPSRIPRLVRALEDAGFASRATDLLELAATSRVLPVRHLATNVPVDLVIAGPGLEESFLERARSMPLGTVLAPVATAEDVVVMKLLAGRATDRDDVVAVLRAQTSFDVAYAAGVLGALEEALGQSDLVPALDDALRRAGRPHRA